MNPYESSELINQYLLFHYGGAEDVLPWSFGPSEALEFPARCVTQTFGFEDAASGARALDIGCAVGRSSFEFSRRCDGVVGIDFSQAFIDTANVLKNKRKISYDRLDEGALTTRLTARVPDGARPEAVSFEVGDATDLREDLGAFDYVLAANLLCRLPEPDRCLRRLPSLVKPGGQLTITTPLTWLDTFTPRDNWLGGFSVDGKPVFTLDTLKKKLGGDFELLRTLELPFLIREHARKYQWSVAQGSVWRRK